MAKNYTLAEKQKANMALWLGCIGIFMVNLDMTIVNVALPTLAEVFSARIGTLSLVLLAYLLSETAMLLPFGRLGDLIGIKRVFISGFVFFTAASLLCGMAPSIRSLIFFRFLQGIGGAMIFAVVLAVITSNTPSEKRMSAMGTATMSAAIGAAIGPSVGGWLTELWSWRLIFLINIPLGVAAVPLGVLFLQNDPPRNVVKQFDWPGMLLSTAGIFMLILALNQGHELGWSSWPILTGLCGSVLLLATFLFWQTRAENPMIDPVFFLNRDLLMLWLVFGLSLMTVGGVLFVFPFLVIDYLGESTAVAGMVMMLVALGQLIGPWAGNLAKRFGVQKVCETGLIAGIVSFALFLMTSETTGLILAVGSLTIFGLAQGLNKGLNLHMLMDYSPDDKKGVTGSLSALVRSVSLAMGIVVFETIFSHYAPPVHGALRPHSHLLLEGFRGAFSVGLLLSIAALAAMFLVRKKHIPESLLSG